MDLLLLQLALGHRLDQVDRFVRGYRQRLGFQVFLCRPVLLGRQLHLSNQYLHFLLRGLGAQLGHHLQVGLFRRQPLQLPFHLGVLLDHRFHVDPSRKEELEL